jgi:hypothetical protein
MDWPAAPFGGGVRLADAVGVDWANLGLPFLDGQGRFGAGAFQIEGDAAQKQQEYEAGAE